jgi:hypothetical protein
MWIGTWILSTYVMSERDPYRRDVGPGDDAERADQRQPRHGAEQTPDRRTPSHSDAPLCELRTIRTEGAVSQVRSFRGNMARPGPPVPASPGIRRGINTSVIIVAGQIHVNPGRRDAFVARLDRGRSSSATGTGLPGLRGRGRSDRARPRQRLRAVGDRRPARGVSRRGTGSGPVVGHRERPRATAPDLVVRPGVGHSTERTSPKESVRRLERGAAVTRRHHRVRAGGVASAPVAGAYDPVFTRRVR